MRPRPDPEPRPLRIAFVASTPARLGPDSLERAPLGGSETSLLLAARELARHGATVYVAAPGAAHEAECAGARLLDLGLAAAGLPAVDIVVSLNRVIGKEALARMAPKRAAYLHWHQNDALSPYGKLFAEPEFAAHADRFVFVSHAQASGFLARCALGPGRVSVIPNPVAPPFCELFAAGAPVLEEKDPDLLVYASAPNRGLDLLLEGVFPRLRAARPGLRLEVYSGFHIDQGLDYAAPGGDAKTGYYEALLASCAASPNVALERGVPKRALAARMRRAAMLCYPCTYRETCCVAALEAMAAGCQVCTTPFAALPETTAGFGYLAAPGRDAGWESLGEPIARTALRALAERSRAPEALERKLRSQIAHVLDNHRPAAIGALWSRLLELEAAP